MTATRHILDKVRTNINITKLILCFSSNNYEADIRSVKPLLNNILKAAKDKLPNCKIIIALIGISNYVNAAQTSTLDELNMALRNKIAEANAINCPFYCYINNPPFNFYISAVKYFIRKLQ